MLKKKTFLPNIFLLNVVFFVRFTWTPILTSEDLLLISIISHYTMVSSCVFWWCCSSNHVTQSSSLITDHISYLQLKSYYHPELHNALFTHLRNTTTIFLDVSLCEIACVWMCYRQAYFGRSLKLMQHIRNSRREQRPQTTHTHTHTAHLFSIIWHTENPLSKSMKKNQPVYQSFSHANQQKHTVMLGSLRLNMDHRLHSRCHSTQASEKQVWIHFPLFI